ncbi:MAG: CaiB/BaiF CoA-transferase family protein [Pseudomonadota bacterium]
MNKALENIRILDLSRVLAGPFCTQIFGDLGAEILKVERPKHGDDTRAWGPPFLECATEQESAYYLSANRNKKSLAIDLKSEDGQAIIHRLLENTDILIENFKVGGLEQYGLSYEQLKDKYPSLIYCSISGFGQTGPAANAPGYDFMAQAFAGLMAANGDADKPPIKVGVALSDIITGLNAAIGILAALNHRHSSGKGQRIDVALTDCTLASLSNLAQYYLTCGEVAPRLGNAHSTIVPYQTFETKDGHIVIAVGNDTQFIHLAGALGHPEWAEDERFAKNSARVKNRRELIPLVAEIITHQSTDEWIRIFKTAGVPAGPVNTMDQVFANEQILSREMKINMPHKVTSQDIDLVGSPLKLSETPVAYEQAPPVLGEHTQEILEKHLGLSEEEIQNLEDKGVIGRA